MERWQRSFNALLVAVLFAIIGFSTSNPIIPLYLRELGITDLAALNWWTGAINGLSNLFFALFAPIWGALADNYGRKLMLLRAMIGGAIVMGLLALTTSPWQVLALKILQGCITGTVAAATVLTASIVPVPQIGYRLGLLQMAIFMGNSIGPLLGGTIADLAGSRISFLATSVILMIASYIVMKNVEEDFAPKPRSKSLLRNAVPDFSALSSNRALLALIVVVFFIQFANSVAGPIIPLVVLDMTRSIKGAGSLSGLIIGVAALGGALGSVFAGRISGKAGYSKVLLLCIAGAFAFSLPQGFASQPWHLFVLRFFSGFFMGGTMPTANALIAAHAEQGKQGSIYGLSSAMSGAGNAAGPAFGALAASLVGYPAIFFATAAILGILGLGVGRQINSRKQRT
jgi:DHA1 family multidrug resistance protein-like MFS transporter